MHGCSTPTNNAENASVTPTLALVLGHVHVCYHACAAVPRQSTPPPTVSGSGKFTALEDSTEFWHYSKKLDFGCQTCLVRVQVASSECALICPLFRARLLSASSFMLCSAGADLRRTYSAPSWSKSASSGKWLI